MHSVQHPSASATAFFTGGAPAASSTRTVVGHQQSAQLQMLSSKRQSKVKQAAPSQQTAARGRAPQQVTAADSSADCTNGEAAPAASGSSDNWWLPSAASSLTSGTPLTVEALKAHDRHTMPQLLKADNGVLLEITSWCDAPEIMILSAVCARFRGTITFHDAFLFRPLCASLWSGRFISSPNLVPFAAMLAAPPSPAPHHHHHQATHHHDHHHNQQTLPGSPIMSPSVSSPHRNTSTSPSGAASSGDFPSVPPQHHHHQHHGSHNNNNSHVQKIHSWREAYVRSIAHSRTTRLTVEELSAANWKIRFLVDESIPAQPITFHRSSGTVRTDGFDPMRYQLYQQGGQLHVHVFPTQTVTRDADTWQWVLHNPFVEISNCSHLPVGVGAAAKTSVPALRPWFPSNCDSPSTYLGMGCGGKLFSSCRDTDCLIDSSHCCSSSHASHPSEDNNKNEDEAAGAESPLPSLKFRSKKKEKKDRKKFEQPTFCIDGLGEGESLHFTLNLTDLDAEDVLQNAGTKVDGHGGDAEDPPSADFGDPPSAAACDGCDSARFSNGQDGATAGSTDEEKGNKRSGSTSRSTREGKTQQQCAGLLSSKSSVLLEKLFSQRDALWEQMGDLHCSQQRALWSDVPSIVEGHKSEHLLDQGRPRKPP